MKAALLYDIGDIRIEDIPRPSPGPGEVLVQVEAVGICGSDIHYYAHGRIGSAVVTEPIVLGHEPAGTVVELGKGVSGPPVGTRVAVEPGRPCGECEFCRRGRYNICRSMRFLGMPPGNPGAYCEYIGAAADFVFPIPDGISTEHGSMARVPELLKFCEQHELKIVSIAKLIEYRLQRESQINRLVSVNLPTDYGEFTLIAYGSMTSAEPHLALCKGDVGQVDDSGNPIEHEEPVLVRVHSECMTGDLFHSQRCECGYQLITALKTIYNG